MTTTTVATCERCGRPMSTGARYCSARCRNRARESRRAARKRAGITLTPDPPNPNGLKATRRQIGALHRLLGDLDPSWAKFARATVPGKRIRVPPDAAAQAKARGLIDRGCCAFVWRDGLIHWIGVPNHPNAQSKVWVSARPRVRDAYERAALLVYLKRAFG